MMIWLSLIVFQIWAFEIWPQIRANYETPSPPPGAKYYISRCLSGLAFSFGSSLRSVKSSSGVLRRKLWTLISQVRGVVETRSQQHIGTQSTRKSSGIDRFIVRHEIIFVKKKSRHFHRAKYLDSVTLDILIVRHDLHRSANDFAIFFVKSTSFGSRK